MFESKNIPDIQKPPRSRSERSWQRVSFCFRWCLMGNKQLIFFILITWIVLFWPFCVQWMNRWYVVFVYGPGLIMYEVQHQEDSDRWSLRCPGGNSPVCCVRDTCVTCLVQSITATGSVQYALYFCVAHLFVMQQTGWYITVIISNQKKCMTYFANLVCFLTLHNIR